MEISTLSRFCCSIFFPVLCFSGFALAAPEISASDRAARNGEMREETVKNPSSVISVGERTDEARGRLTDPTHDRAPGGNKDYRDRERARREAARDVALMMMGISRRTSPGR